MEKKFHKYDRDNNGTISVFEIGELVREEGIWC